MAAITFTDLTGIKTEGLDNPFDALILASEHDPAKLQGFYESHRSKRNEQQQAKILDPSFEAWTPDTILAKLDGPRRDSSFVDPRFCLVLWARPTAAIKKLILMLQTEIQKVAPDLWLMPQDNLHITAMEVAHSRTEQEIEELVDTLLPNAEKLTDFLLDHRARLIKPMIGYDTSALALSFVPAAGEALSHERTADDDAYSYHQLRGDLHVGLKEAGVPVASRYCVPSAHLTIARFTSQDGFVDRNGAIEPEKVKMLVDKINELNAWLKEDFWPVDDSIKPGGEWLLGQEKGLDFRKGQLWYGGGETVHLGRGF